MIVVYVVPGILLQRMFHMMMVMLSIVYLTLMNEYDIGCIFVKCVVLSQLTYLKELMIKELGHLYVEFIEKEQFLRQTVVSLLYVNVQYQRKNRNYLVKYFYYLLNVFIYLLNYYYLVKVFIYLLNNHFYLLNNIPPMYALMITMSHTKITTTSEHAKTQTDSSYPTREQKKNNDKGNDNIFLRRK